MLIGLPVFGINKYFILNVINFQQCMYGERFSEQMHLRQRKAILTAVLMDCIAHFHSFRKILKLCSKKRNTRKKCSIFGAELNIQHDLPKTMQDNLF